MCGQGLPLQWFTLDVAYVLVLLGGSLVMKAKRSPPIVWVTFGILATAVGGLLFAATSMASAAMGQEMAAAGAVGMLGSC